MTDLIYTLCFLKRQSTVLMLKRINPPNKGLWNGVGGHIQRNETPFACALREIKEETGYELNHVYFEGILTWDGFEIADGGLYIYTADIPSGNFIECDEGLLEWKDFQWVLSSPEVVSNIHFFGPHLFNNNSPQEFHFSYSNGNIINFLIKPLRVKKQEGSI